jgi:hypothetical protein
MPYNNERKSLNTKVLTIGFGSRLFPLRSIINIKMAISKKISITTVSREILIVRTNEGQNRKKFCADCAIETEMVDINSAVTIFGVGTRELMRLAEIGLIHSIETGSGHLLICVNSLKAS